MKNPGITTLIELLQRTFDGKAWHGPSVMSVLNELEEDQLLNKRGDSHSIAVLVAHMYAWRLFAIKNLQGENDFEVSDELNFPTIDSIDNELWEQLLAQLKQSQTDLLALLRKQEDSLLEQIVPGKPYPYLELLHGCIHHDLYHLGQIVLLRKQTNIRFHKL